MKLLCTLALALALPFGAARADAPKDPPKEAPKADAPSKADVDKFLAFFDKMVETVIADKADCPKMATDLTKLIDANQELIKKGQESKAKGQKLPQDARDHMDAGSKKMFAAMQEKCMNDKAVISALERMKAK